MVDQWNYRLSGNRDALLDQTARVFDCNRADAVTQALRFTLAMTGNNTLNPTGNLQQAINHPDMTSELAELLSTNQVRIEYTVESDVVVE